MSGPSWSSVVSDEIGKLKGPLSFVGRGLILLATVVLLVGLVVLIASIPYLLYYLTSFELAVVLSLCLIWFVSLLR